MSRTHRITGPTRRRRYKQVPRLNNNNQSSIGDITGRVQERDESAVVPELDNSAVSPEPEAPSIAESDDEFYSNIANVYEPHFYPFPNDSALEHVRT
ncbi:hypothetical protein EV176_004205, partial [Coemansia sp. RSA 451]